MKTNQYKKETKKETCSPCQRESSLFHRIVYNVTQDHVIYAACVFGELGRIPA